MKILAINGSYRREGTTTQLTEKALEGAAAEGAETRMVLLDEQDIGYCRNCLTCYKDLTSEIGPCILDDDVREILEAIRDADGVIFSSPVHSGFVTGIMTSFIERATFTLMRPTGEIMGLKGCPAPRLMNKARACATIVSAGGIPQEMREFCDLGSPWLRDSIVCMCNGELIGDIYAGAFFAKELEEDEWKRSYLFRKLTPEQFQEAYQLGQKIAWIVKNGETKPFDPQQWVQTGALRVSDN